MDQIHAAKSTPMTPQQEQRLRELIAELELQSLESARNEKREAIVDFVRGIVDSADIS